MSTQKCPWDHHLREGEETRGWGRGRSFCTAGPSTAAATPSCALELEWPFICQPLDVDWLRWEDSLQPGQPLKRLRTEGSPPATLAQQLGQRVLQGRGIWAAWLRIHHNSVFWTFQVWLSVVSVLPYLTRYCGYQDTQKKNKDEVLRFFGPYYPLRICYKPCISLRANIRKFLHTILRGSQMLPRPQLSRTSG